MPWTICRYCVKMGYSAAAADSLIRPCTCDHPDLAEMDAGAAERYCRIVEGVALPPRGPRGAPSNGQRVNALLDGVADALKRIFDPESGE